MLDIKKYLLHFISVLGSVLGYIPAAIYAYVYSEFFTKYFISLPRATYHEIG